MSRVMLSSLPGQVFGPLRRASNMGSSKSLQAPLQGPSSCEKWRCSRTNCKPSLRLSCQNVIFVFSMPRCASVGLLSYLLWCVSYWPYCCWIWCSDTCVVMACPQSTRRSTAHFDAAPSEKALCEMAISGIATIGTAPICNSADRESIILERPIRKSTLQRAVFEIAPSWKVLCEISVFEIAIFEIALYGGVLFGTAPSSPGKSTIWTKFFLKLVSSSPAKSAILKSAFWNSAEQPS